MSEMNFQPWYQRLADKVPKEVWEVLIFVFLLAIPVVVVAFFGYPHRNEADTRRTLESSGYSNIEIRDEGGWFACGDGDFYKTPFRADNPKGDRVEGVVCCGLLAKDCTTRF